MQCLVQSFVQKGKMAAMYLLCRGNDKWFGNADCKAFNEKTRRYGKENGSDAKNIEEIENQFTGSADVHVRLASSGEP